MKMFDNNNSQNDNIEDNNKIKSKKYRYIYCKFRLSCSYHNVYVLERIRYNRLFRIFYIILFILFFINSK